MVVNSTPLLQSICLWMSYQHVIGRDGVIHESSVRYPSIEFLTSGAMPASSIRFEAPHPVFKRRLVDATVEHSNEELDDESGRRAAIEFKLVSAATARVDGPEFTRLIDDIFRLAAYNYRFRDTECFLVLVGKADAFQSYFISSSTSITNASEALQPKKSNNHGAGTSQKTSPYEQWLPLNSDVPLCIDLMNNACKKQWDRFSGEYEARELNSCEIGSKISVQLVAHNYSLPVPLPYVGCVWRINSVE